MAVHPGNEINGSRGTAVLGLSSAAAIDRRQQYGVNEIEREKARPAWKLFVEQFKSPLVAILIFACALSIGLGEHLEGIAIGCILVLNSLIGFFQEYRAESAISALRAMTAPRARVFRDGQQTLIAARDVVPGDVLALEAGDIVAADGKIIEDSRFEVNEAVLTGESLPVTKSATGEDRTKLVFTGTSVITGTAVSEVTAIGMETELGKIAHLIATAEITPTPLQIQLARLGKSLLWICLGVVGVVIAIGLLQGKSWLDVLIFSVSLAVAAVPEGMPAIVTVALALGVRRLAARHALVRKLHSVETLGSVSVICTDKTGTLTTGNMRIREFWGEDQVGTLRAAAACCDAELTGTETNGTGDSTEIAILIAAREQKIEKGDIEVQNPRVKSEPFDPERRRMSILRKDGINYVKGAVENVLAICKPGDPGAQAATKAAAEMASRGLRILAIAVGQGPGEQNLDLVGLVGIADPPRPEAKQAIQEARDAGIRSIMITGDHPNTAAAIAREIGLLVDNETVAGRVHARATPEEKLNLVRDWKRQGAVVAMTGDGVNDAPALREAHIGIAMGMAGTEVTRQSADIILADDNFATIVAAVREGRSIFQNIRRAISYLLTGNFAEIAVVLGAIALGLPLPLLASHLLWINLVTDALPALTLAAEPVPADIMKRPPRSPTEPIMGWPEWRQVLWVGLLEAGLMLALYSRLLSDRPEADARGVVFTAFVASQVLRSFGARSRKRLLWEIGPFTNRWLLGVAVLTLTLQVGLHFIPIARPIFGLKALTLPDVFLILPFVLVPVSVIEITKIVRRIFFR